MSSTLPCIDEPVERFEQPDDVREMEARRVEEGVAKRTLDNLPELRPCDELRVARSCFT